MSTEESKLNQMRDRVDDQVVEIQVSIDQIQDQIDELAEQGDAIEVALMDVAASELEPYLYGKATELQYPILTFQGFWVTATSYVVNDSVTIADDSTGGQFVCILDNTSDSTNEPGSGASWTTYWTVALPLTTIRVKLGAAYNNTSINGWKIQQYQLIPNPTPPYLPPFINAWVTIYAYLGVGWDGDTQIIELQDDWDFGCDYLNHLLGIAATEENSPGCVERVALGVAASYGIDPKIEALESAKTIITNNQSKVDDSKDVFDRYLED